MIVGGYTMHLYCDNDETRHPSKLHGKAYYGRTFTGCARQARQDGWFIEKRAGRVICPMCRKKGEWQDE